MNGGLQKPTGITINTPVTQQAIKNGSYREPTWGVDNTTKPRYNINNEVKPWYMSGGKSKRRKNKKSGKKSKRKTRK
jgi:hypothetical protein